MCRWVRGHANGVVYPVWRRPERTHAAVLPGCGRQQHWGLAAWSKQSSSLEWMELGGAAAAAAGQHIIGTRRAPPAASKRAQRALHVGSAPLPHILPCLPCRRQGGHPHHPGG